VTSVGENEEKAKPIPPPPPPSCVFLNAQNSKRLQTTQTQLQEISHAQEHNQEISYAQAQLQETSIQTELQRKLFKVEHLIYN